MKDEKRELEDRISEVANRQLQREQLLMQRIKRLEQTIKENKMETRVKHLESFRDFSVILSAVLVMIKLFV